ncbi:hypothetical protein NDU88_006070 [Pleurodeles waltl]|uniref:Uncharacterized protein n=1 Tax=Pleurodeles waltl TaxID=8319 RepID=A0AAV7TEH1_PLEWA|nr:hypothetical protein NDU88_006070 [Pleurodeles waltl]
MTMPRLAHHSPGWTNACCSPGQGGRSGGLIPQEKRGVLYWHLTVGGMALMLLAQSLLGLAVEKAYLRRVYIRGIAIAKYAGVLKAQHRRLPTLKPQKAQLQCDHLVNADKRLRSLIHEKLKDFQETTHYEVQHMGKYAMERAYGESDRSGIVLATMMHLRRELDLRAPGHRWPLITVPAGLTKILELQDTDGH